MELKERKRQLDPVWWRCVDCRTWRSIRKDSFFEHSHLSLMQWSLILFHWSTKTPSQQIQTLTGLSEKTIIKVLSGIHTICSIKIGQDNIRLGGPGIIIEIDESKFGACQKYHRGRASHGPWVFGMVERTWSENVKRKLKNMNGTSNNSLPSYLDEFMWFKLYNGDSMMNILSHISDAYPL